MIRGMEAREVEEARKAEARAGSGAGGWDAGGGGGDDEDCAIDLTDDGPWQIQPKGGAPASPEVIWID